jgi:hypothetical protein
MPRTAARRPEARLAEGFLGREAVGVHREVALQV